MKEALCILDGALQAEGYVPGDDYEFCANVHDEWQASCKNMEVAKRFGELSVESIRKAGETFNFRCPLDGEYKIGMNWAETH